MQAWRIGCVLGILAACQPAWSAERITGERFATRSTVIAPRGMACTSHSQASQIAVDVLRAGGSAVDAAIAANAALAFLEPTSNGLGGDLFALVWDAEKKQLHGLNASGRSPRSLTAMEFQRRGLTRIPRAGVLPISVPGCVDGWGQLHRRFGRMPWGDLLVPTIRLARRGYPVAPVIARYWSGGAAALREQPGFADTFLVEGRAPQAGESFRNPDLARTLERIAAAGPDVFYRGAIADEICRFVQAQGGFLKREDLAAHRSDWVDPVSTTYRGFRLWELPPNGQGIAALQMLNLLEGYPIKQFGFGSADHLHVLLEAKKLTFEDRARYYADPDFHPLPVARLISKEYAEARRKLIDLKHASQDVAAGDITEGDTIYLTVADKDRYFVSLIQSNYRGFGSGVCPPGLGFGLQNRGELFALEEGHFNAYAPAKRPFHTIIPAFVTKDDQPYMSFGVMGGAMQPQGHVQILLNHIDFGMNIQEAGDAPRVRHAGSSQPTGETMEAGGTVHLEREFAQGVRDELQKRGHRLAPTRGGYGGYQAIRWDAERDVYFGASESRKDGCALGY